MMRRSVALISERRAEIGIEIDRLQKNRGDSPSSGDLAGIDTNELH